MYCILLKTGICWWPWYWCIAWLLQTYAGMLPMYFEDGVIDINIFTLYTIPIRRGCYFSQSIDLTTCGLGCCIIEPNRFAQIKSINRCSSETFSCHMPTIWVCYSSSSLRWSGLTIPKIVVNSLINLLLVSVVSIESIIDARLTFTIMKWINIQPFFDRLSTRKYTDIW